MKKTTLNQISLLISLIACCNTLNAMEKETKKTNAATSTTVHRHALRSKGNNLFHNTNLITRANVSPKIARAKKVVPQKSLKSLPLPSSPIKRKNLEDYKQQNLMAVDVFSPATEESSSSSFSSSEETDSSSIDVFSEQKKYSSLLTEFQPSEGLSFEDLFMDVQTSTKDFSLDDFSLQVSLHEFLLDQIQ